MPVLLFFKADGDNWQCHLSLFIPESDKLGCVRVVEVSKRWKEKKITVSFNEGLAIVK